MRILLPSPEKAAQFPLPEDAFCSQMAERMGEFALRRRLCGEAIQREAFSKGFFTSEGELRDRSLPVRALEALFRLLRLEKRAKRNFETIRIVEKDISLEGAGLSPVWDGFRILHLSDFHLDFDPSLVARLKPLLETLDYDVACLTGDFNDLTIDVNRMDRKLFRELANQLRAPAYAVLGNHDVLATCEILESVGISVLLNESVRLEREGESLLLAGVDDPRLFRGDDLERALANRRGKEPAILLAHAPQIHREAAEKGVHLMLCGHTHGGQVCLPGGLPLIHRFKCPLRLVAGYWRDGPLQGYTSRGCGGCKLPYRFNAPAEVSLLTIRA